MRTRTRGTATVMMAAAFALVAQIAIAGDASSGNLQTFNGISKAVNNYVYFTIFDDVNARIDEGTVTLTGKVTMPYKSNDIAKRVAKVAGVTRVVNRIEVLPVSSWDDQLRYRIARAIYGNLNFVNFANVANPPIHIVVEHGRVTLTGVVPNEVDRMVARSLVTQFGVMSVKNELKTDAEMRDLLEKL